MAEGKTTSEMTMKLKNLVDEVVAQAERLDEDGVKTAAGKVRKLMQEVRRLAQEIRVAALEKRKELDGK